MPVDHIKKGSIPIAFGGIHIRATCRRKHKNCSIRVEIGGFGFGVNLSVDKKT